MTPPDSGEREVCGECGSLKGPWYPYCSKAGAGLGAHGAQHPQIEIPRPLAQRILAALDSVAHAGSGYAALASELRAAVERKP